MNLKGKVVQLLPVETGTSKNGEWKKQSVILETEGQYPKKVCITLWGDKVETVTNGANIDIAIDAESREYNGRWYTELKAWKIDINGDLPKQTSPASSTSSDKEETGDDLPF